MFKTKIELQNGELVVHQYIGSSWRIVGFAPLYAKKMLMKSHRYLANLDKDDHSQYHNDDRGDERYYLKSEVDDLLDGVASDDSCSPETIRDTVGVMFTDTATIDFTYNDAADTVIADVIPAGISHGDLADLGVDDHTLYSLADGTRAFTGVIGGITPTSGSHLATKDYVDTYVLGLDWQDSVLDRYDPTSSTPPGPSIGDRYISTATANGWTINNIYEYNGATWDETVVNEGMTTWVEDEDLNYVYNGTSWVKMGTTITHDDTSGVANSTAHTKFLLLDGSRSMVGNLDVNQNNIKDVINILAYSNTVRVTGGADMAFDIYDDDDGDPILTYTEIGSGLRGGIKLHNSNTPSIAGYNEMQFLLGTTFAKFMDLHEIQNQVNMYKTVDMNSQAIVNCPSIGGASPDEKVKVSAADTTSDYLSKKIMADTGVNPTNALEGSIIGPGGDEDFKIRLDEDKFVEAASSQKGVVSVNAQTFTGAKTFESDVYIQGELSIKVYTQTSEPTLDTTNKMCIWIDSDDGNRVFLIFRKDVSNQVSVELK